MSQTLDWRCLTIEDFFTQHNWTGHKPPQVLTVSPPQAKQPPPSSQSSVKRTAEEKIKPQNKTEITTPKKLKTEPLTSDNITKERKKIVSWQCSSVERFFSQNNWLGQPKELNFQAVIDLNSLDLEEIEISENNEQSLGKISNLETETLVKENQIINSSTTLKTVEKSPIIREFSLTLPVQDFLAAFDWQGKPAIAVLPQIKIPQATSSKEEEFTLDDLSQLF